MEDHSPGTNHPHRTEMEAAAAAAAKMDPVGYWGHPGHYENIATLYDRRLLTSTTQEMKRKAAAAAAQFTQEFQAQYGLKGPIFSHHDLTDSLVIACNTVQRNSEEERILAVYLHHPDGPQTHTFCSEVLCHPAVTKLLDDCFILWGWDLGRHRYSHSNTKSIHDLLGVRLITDGFLGFRVAMKIRTLQTHQLPLLFTTMCTRYGWEILSLVHGSCSADELLACLEGTRQLHAAQGVITRQRQEEEPCERRMQFNTLYESDELVQLEGSERERPNVAAWAIPLSRQYRQELIDLRERLHQQRLEQSERREAWAKVVGRAVLDGVDAATLRQLVDEENGDLSVLVRMPDQWSTTCCLLTLAAWQGQLHLLPLLLEAGLDVEGGGSTHDTPLMVAASRGHAGVVEALLGRGASCTARDRNGITALHQAAFYGHQACVALLIPATLAAHPHGPDSLTDKDGLTPLHSASFQGHWEVMQQLRAAGWSLHAVDWHGNTALHLVARSGALRPVQALVGAGLSPSQANQEGQTALSLAEQHGHHDVEAWLLKRQQQRQHGHFLRHATTASTLHLMRRQMDQDATMYNRYKTCARNLQSADRLGELLQVNDPHLVDRRGWTILHQLGDDAYLRHPSLLTPDFGHHHALTHDGLTPLDLARRHHRSTKAHKEMVQLLQQHQCPKVPGTPEELYLRLLTVITRGDDAREASRLLCAGAPMELTGGFPGSALQQAVTNDRSRIVSLLLVAGASLTASSQGLNLLQQAWYSPNTTAQVHAALTLAFSRQLKRERDRLPHSRTKGLRDDLALLIAAIDGDAPWAAAWPEEATTKGRTERRTMARLTQFMVSAARTNCPLVAAFLRWAGAWPFFRSGQGGTALHAAIRAGHLAMAEVLVRDLGASLYIPDASHMPRDVEQLPQHTLSHLQMVMYQRERQQLEALAGQQKDTSERERVEAVAAVQEGLFQHYLADPLGGRDVGQAAGREALLVATRQGLLQLLHLLLAVARLPPDTILDPICGTTALHEAAAHGKSGCVAHLLTALKNRAATATIADADNQRLHRYSPLQPDRYGQTALHLAAMFGHQHTLELLQQSVGRAALPCRAGTSDTEVHHNFLAYLRRYTRHHHEARREAASPADHWDAAATLKRLLGTVDVARLPAEARRANVDFSEEGEAKRVRQAVMRTAGILLGRAASTSTPYMAGRALRPRLVGSSRDGSKLFCPDEFDINVVVAAGPQEASVAVLREADHSLAYRGHTLRIEVETQDPRLQGETLAEDLYQALREALTDSVLDERRLSLVPPGLTKTQVGVALTLAWQGDQYPLLLVGVDLVPVLEVPWHPAIARPALTPPTTSAMQLSAARDGSWRCSFAWLEAEVLAGLSPEERSVQLSAKLLLSTLKAERWMPRRIKTLSTWWCGRSWQVPVPAGFCLKTALFLVLEDKRRAGTRWREADTVLRVMQVFERMCSGSGGEPARPGSRPDPPPLPRRMKAYFGGECEATKDASSAPVIAGHLRRVLKRHQPRDLWWLARRGWQCWLWLARRCWRCWRGLRSLTGLTPTSNKGKQ